MSKKKKVKALKKNKSKKTLKQKKKVSKLSKKEILMELQKISKILVLNTVNKYKNGNLASIFNESDMTALAEDTALEVTRRVLVYYKNPNHKDAVEIKGYKAYFSRAFINQCQKYYEKYAKTDTRAGIQTVSSEEAMAVASTKNLINPEHKYILNRELNFLLEKLQSLDNSHNERRTKELQQVGITPSNFHLQNSALIIQKTLEGFEANEIKSMLAITDIEYAKQRKAALELAKQVLPYDFSDLCEHFEVATDYRVLIKDVKKRKKIQNKLKNLSFSSNFCIQSKPENKSCKTTLFVRIDPMDGDDRVKEIPSKMIALEEITSSIDSAIEVRKTLWEKTKKPEILQKVNEYGQDLVKKAQAA